jgi:hypothetical protein
MTIVVENGTGLADAVSYASAADADTYWLSEADETWSGFSTAEKEIALVRATREIEALYSARFIGQRNSTAQALSWPRTNAVDRDGLLREGEVPAPVALATIELARTTATEDPRTTADVSDVASETIKVGPIELSTDYTDARVSARKRIEQLLASVIVGGMSQRLHRT